MVKNGHEHTGNISNAYSCCRLNFTEDWRDGSVVKPGDLQKTQAETSSPSRGSSQLPVTPVAALYGLVHSRAHSAPKPIIKISWS